MFNNFLFFSGFPATTGRGAAPPHGGGEGGVERAVLDDRQGRVGLHRVVRAQGGVDLAGFKVPGWRVREMISKTSKHLFH